MSTKRLLIFLLVFALPASFLLALTSCKRDAPTYVWEWPDPKEDEEEEEEENNNGNEGNEGNRDGNPRFLWVDAAANFPDFANSRENIAKDLATAKAVGFTDIVVDVRPTSGEVLFRTDVAPQVDWLGAWVGGVYSRVDRTESWDYLEAFIEECKELDLRVHAAINTFVGGRTSDLGTQGVLYTEPDKLAWATQLNTESGIFSIMQVDSKSAKFFNPVMPAVQDYLCDMLADLAAYKSLDGIFLDRGRFDGMQSDFSDYTRTEFEKYIGNTLTSFPESVMPRGKSGTGVPDPEPAYFRKWLEFRAKVIYEFIQKASARVKSVNPDIKFGVYVGGWYDSYYDVGVNWGSKLYNTAANHSWASADYNKYGYAELVDQMLIGAYASADKVYGTGEWTIEGFCKKAVDYTMGVVPVLAGGPDVGNWKVPEGTDELKAIENSVPACINACGGYFLFDMIHLKQKPDKWTAVKNGIEKATAK